MTKGFQTRGDKNNPFHLSIGTVCTHENKVALIKKADSTYTLPRETMYSEESLEEALLRGIEEELGIKAKVVRYIGCLITHFNRPDGSDIEKTTIYFLSERTGDSTKSQAEDETADTIEWFEKDTCIKLLEEQNNKEFELVSRIS